jgi:hypothetical protein
VGGISISFASQPAGNDQTRRRAGIDHAADVLLDEQRVAATAPAQFFLQRLEARVIAEQRGYEIVRRFGRRPLSRNSGVSPAARSRAS